jgi:thiol:disulfide interchange protein DsbD
MKQYSIIAMIIFLLGSNTFAQNSEQPVSWEFETEQISKNEYRLILKADIDKAWYMYGRNIEDGGPLPLEISFEENSDYTISGDITETETPITEYDDIFEIDIEYFSGKVSFMQTVSISGNRPVSFPVNIYGQACRKVSGVCVPIDAEHIFIIK